MARPLPALKVLVALAAVILAVVTWLPKEVWEREKPEPLPLVLQELVRSGKAERADASNGDPPAARFERLLAGNTFAYNLSQPGTLSELRKTFLRNMAEAILQVECSPTSHWNSASAFSNGVAFATPSTYRHGIERIHRLSHAALRVQGQDGVRSLGPALFARQLGFGVEDVVYPPIADLAADALENTNHPGRLRYPQEAIKLGPEGWYAALRVWWLEKAKGSGWDEELKVVQRMMEERGIRPDGTGGYLRQRARE